MSKFWFAVFIVIRTALLALTLISISLGWNFVLQYTFATLSPLFWGLSTYAEDLARQKQAGLTIPMETEL